MYTYQHNYLAKDNDDRMSRIININLVLFNLILKIKFTSIHRSHIEQCEHRGGRYILHVRQYFI